MFVYISAIWNHSMLIKSTYSYTLRIQQKVLQLCISNFHPHISPGTCQPVNMHKKTNNKKKTFVGNHIEHGKHWHHSLVPQHVHLRRHQYIHAHTWLCSFLYLPHAHFFLQVYTTNFMYYKS